MEVKYLNIEGPVLLHMPFFEDFRGGFSETYHSEKFKQILGEQKFLQDNESVSHKNVLRGLHFQLPPHEQGKLVRVSRGSALDVLVDLRKNSKTYGNYFSIVLSEQNRLQLWIPSGFAHGFLALEDNTLFSYKCTALYNKDSECAIKWDDKDLNIDWNISQPIISEKDNEAMRFKDFNSPF
jgi:dTDP-4-dehydrorhamnose 3,5-epimerase